MTDLEVPQTGAKVSGAPDGRNVRRERNIERVLDVVMEMFGDDALFPTMDQVAERSGLSLRSLYRYFADPSALVHAAIERHHGLINEAAHLAAIGSGPLAKRIDDFVAMRLRVYEQFGPAFRASLANAHRHEMVAAVLAERRREMRDQFEHQFATELAGAGAGRAALLRAGHALTLLDTVHLMHMQGDSEKQIRQSLSQALHRLLSAEQAR